MFWLLLIAALCILITVFIKTVNYKHKLWERRCVPYIPPKFLLGNFGEIIFRKSTPAELFNQIYFNFPKARYVGGYSFTMPVLILKDPELIKQITVKNFDHFTDHRPFVPPEVDPLWGKNLLTLKGKIWKNMRATLSPVFTSSKMKQIFTLMDECAKNAVDHMLEAKPEEIEQIEAKDFFSRFSNDIIATSAFGITCNSFKNKNDEFYKMGKELTDFSTFQKMFAFGAYMASPSLAKFFGVQMFPQNLSRIFTNIVKDSIKLREEKNIKRADMIDIMMEAKKNSLKHDEEKVSESNFAATEESEFVKTHEEKAEITNDDIASQAVIFFFAGFETVSTVMSFIAYELSANPEAHEKLQEEIDMHLLGNRNKLTYEMIAQMKYLDMVVCETLRKWPPTIITDRLCTKPITIEAKLPDEKPLHIEPGEFIAIPNFSIQNDPEYFPNPEKFDPERFNEENKHSINPYTYMPFSIGPRSCIGSRFALQEIKIFFVHLLSKFDILLAEKSTVPLKISKKSGTLNAEGGIWFKLKQRS